jgi:hypothetical protein
MEPGPIKYPSKCPLSPASLSKAGKLAPVPRLLSDMEVHMTYVLSDEVSTEAEEKKQFQLQGIALLQVYLLAKDCGCSLREKD